jgi:hypothetical protein
MLLGLFGISWVMLRSVLGLPECWQGQFGRSRNIGVWMVVPHCLMLCPWQECNGLSFQNFERSLVGLKFLLFRTLFDWVFIRGSVFFFFFDK